MKIEISGGVEHSTLQSGIFSLKIVNSYFRSEVLVSNILYFRLGE